MLTEFKLLEEIKGVGQKIDHLTESLKNANLQFKDLNVGIRSSSKSANKSSYAMMFLTAALVLFAFAQVAVAWLGYKADQKIIEIKRNCYRQVLQTSNIDLNYKSCLRDNGLSD